MAKVSKITVEQEVTKVVEEVRYALELTIREADVLQYILTLGIANLFEQGNVEVAESIRDALYDAGVRAG